MCVLSVHAYIYSHLFVSYNVCMAVSLHVYVDLESACIYIIHSPEGRFWGMEMLPLLVQ